MRRGACAAAGAWLVLAAAAVFAFLAWQVLTGGLLTHLDAGLTQAMVQRRTTGLTQAMLLLAWVNGTVPLLAATAALMAWRAWRRDWRWLAALWVVPTGMLLNVLLKILFGRLRPALDEPLVHLSTFSFPSGHAVASTVFYGVLCAFVLAHLRSTALRALALLAAAMLVALVCFSRVYLGAHYPSDVLAGASVGLGWLLTWLALTRSKPLWPGRQGQRPGRG